MRLRWIVALLCVVFSFAAVRAQGGFRFITVHIEPVFPGENSDDLDALNSPIYAPFTGQYYHFGFGYDKDLEEYLSMAVELMFSQGMFGGRNAAITMQYRSAFHLQSNQQSSAYIGPLVAFRMVDVTTYENKVLREESKTVFPLGLRMGVRGDLRGFYADLYASVVFQIGGEELTSTSTYVPPVPITYAIGFDMGIGWDKRTNK